jgi:N-acetylmuramoyl-L-alanine amidase
MPAALGEGLFLTNPTEAAKLKDPAILEAIAQGYAKGIMGYYQ